MDSSSWGEDVAVACLLGKVDKAVHKISHAETTQFMTRELAEFLELGIGDEVVMIGRFMNHQGRYYNKPAARFGNISMMPEPIWNRGIGKDQLSYAVEMRSRTGFSGSLVAVYRTPYTTLAANINKQSFFGVLGVNWGYIHDEDGENTWLNGVAPAWQILETLEVPALANLQKLAVERQERLYGSATPAVVVMTGSGVSESNGVPSRDENPNHLEDFTRLVDVAARKRPQGDRT